MKTKFSKRALKLAGQYAQLDPVFGYPDLNAAIVMAKAIRTAADREHAAWLAGFAVALAELHRQLLHGNNSSGTCAAARNAGLTIASARAAGVSAFDLKELRKAGLQ